MLETQIEVFFYETRLTDLGPSIENSPTQNFDASNS